MIYVINRLRQHQTAGATENNKGVPLGFFFFFVVKSTYSKGKGGGGGGGEGR